MLFYFWFLFKEKFFSFSVLHWVFLFFFNTYSTSLSVETKFLLLNNCRKISLFALSKNWFPLLTECSIIETFFFSLSFNWNSKIIFYPPIKSFLFQMLFSIEISIDVVHHVIVFFLPHNIFSLQNNFSSYPIILLKTIFFSTEKSMFHL